MTKTVTGVAQHVIQFAKDNDLDIADIVSEIRTTTILGVESEEMVLQAKLLQLRTLKIKLSKI